MIHLMGIINKFFTLYSVKAPLNVHSHCLYTTFARWCNTGVHNKLRIRLKFITNLNNWEWQTQDLQPVSVWRKLLFPLVGLKVSKPGLASLDTCILGETWPTIYRGRRGQSGRTSSLWRSTAWTGVWSCTRRGWGTLLNCGVDSGVGGDGVGMLV